MCNLLLFTEFAARVRGSNRGNFLVKKDKKADNVGADYKYLP